jgi:hypothetical protein
MGEEPAVVVGHNGVTADPTSAAGRHELSARQREKLNFICSGNSSALPSNGWIPVWSAKVAPIRPN